MKGPSCAAASPARLRRGPALDPANGHPDRRGVAHRQRYLSDLRHVVDERPQPLDRRVARDVDGHADGSRGGAHPGKVAIDLYRHIRQRDPLRCRLAIEIVRDATADGEVEQLTAAQPEAATAPSTGRSTISVCVPAAPTAVGPSWRVCKVTRNASDTPPIVALMLRGGSDGLCNILLQSQKPCAAVPGGSGSEG